LLRFLIASVLLLEIVQGDNVRSDNSGKKESEPSYLEELEKLAALRDQGIISDEEFEAKKAQLLNP